MQGDKSAACVNKRRGSFSVKQALNLEATPKSSQKALQTSTQVLPVSRQATDEKILIFISFNHEIAILLFLSKEKLLPQERSADS